MGKGILDDITPSLELEGQGILGDLVPDATQESPSTDPWEMLKSEMQQPAIHSAWSPIVAPIFDLLSRGEYASANVAEAIAEGRWEDIPSVAWQGVTGKTKGDYTALAHEKLPKEWPSWIKTAIGFAGNVLLDPLNWMGFGAVTKSGSRSLLSFAGRGLGDMPGLLGKFGKAVDMKVFGTLDDAVKAARHTPAGQWLVKHFSARGPIDDVNLWRRYQEAQDQANFLISRAIENNIPYEKAIQDIERNLNIPREVIMDLVEKPVVYKEVQMTQLALPFDEMMTPTFPGPPHHVPPTPEPKAASLAPAPKPVEQPRLPLKGPATPVPQTPAAPLASQVPTGAATRGPKAAAPKPYEGLRPGTPEWMDVWKHYPELQQEMLEYVKKIRAGETPPPPQAAAQPPTQATIPETKQIKPAPQPVSKPGTTPSVGKEVQQQLPEIQDVWTKPVPLYLTHEVKQGDTLDSIAKLYHTTPQRLKEINPNLPSPNKLKPGQPLHVPLMERVERTWAYPPEVQGLVNQFRELQRVRVATEKAAGIPIEALQSDVIEYMGHYVTPEAQAALKAQGGPVWRSKFKSLLDTKIQHPSIQTRSIRDLTVEEVNRLAKQGMIIPGYKGPLFIEDPVLVNTIRDIMSARSVAAADFIRDVAINPEWASDAAAVKGYAGWRPLSEAAQKKFGDLVKGKVFRDDIAAALDTYVQKAFNPDTVDEFVKLYDKWLSIWKTYTLGTSPAWMVNNMVGNLWNGFLLSGANPTAFNDGFRLMLRGKDSKLIHTIKPGETLSSIAQQYNVTVDQLKNMNMIKDPNRIIAGAKIEIPQGVKSALGYTDAEVFSLAQQHGLLYRGLYGSEGAKQLQEQIKGTITAKDIITAPTKPIFAANQFLENWARLSLFVDGLKRGLTPEYAAMRVKKYLFDYSQLTATEKNIFKRIVPFYAWLRFNIPLQIEHLITQFGKYSLIPKAMNAWMQEQGGPIEPGAALPEWMQEGLYLQTGNPSPDVARFISLRGLPPVDLIQTLVELSKGEVPSVITGANPLLSAMLATKGYETYSGREIPKDSLKTLVPGVTLPERQATALTELVPPLATLSKLLAPNENPLLPDKTLGQKLASLLMGVRQYDRSISQDTLRLINTYQSRIYDISDKYAGALQAGDVARAEAYRRLLDDVIEQFTDALQSLQVQQGGGVK